MSRVTKPKSRLGRGLSSLISVSDLPVEVDAAPAAPPAGSAGTGDRTATVEGSDAPPGDAAREGIVPAEIPLDAVTANPHQPRRRMDEASLAELAASLKSTGLIQPIIVRRIETGYQLIAGERRLRAARLAGLRSLPAIVREVDSFTQAQMALIENIQREDLNALDRAQSYRALMDQLGLTQAELATRLGEDRSSIANFLRLLDLTEPVRELVRDGKLSLGHAKILAGVEDILEQQRLAELVITQDLSVRNLERLVQSGPTPATTTRREPAGSAHIHDLEKTIARQLGMRVQLRSSKQGKGRLVIHYGSLDQFDELLSRMGVRPE
jgi:ParB family transcriptional regulator, chromosome partitioning protein